MDDSLGGRLRCRCAAAEVDRRGGLGGASRQDHRWRHRHARRCLRDRGQARSSRPRDRDQPKAADVVRSVETIVQQDLRRIAEAKLNMMVGYQRVLVEDQKSEGWLTQRLSPRSSPWPLTAAS